MELQRKVEITVGFEEIYGNKPIREILIDKDVITIVDEDQDSESDWESTSGEEVDHEEGWEEKMKKLSWEE